MTQSDDILNKLGKALAPVPESANSLPDPKRMVQFGLEILANSETGSRLASLATEQNFQIDVIKTPEETAYMPETGKIQIGMRVNPPTSPARFVLILTGILREAEQELAGKKHPELHEPITKHLSISVSKESDKVAHMCAVAYELNQILDFTEYSFFDELRKMGYTESINKYIEVADKETAQ